MAIDDIRSEVRRAARGDEDAASLLFDEYYPRVYRYALAKLRDPYDAEDVAAETFARVIRHLDRFRWKAGGFEAWLFRIAANLVVDQVRARERETTDPEGTQDDRPGEDDPERDAMQAESAGELDRMLADLPEEQREVLLLRFGAGLDTHEVGAVMKKRPNAVRQLQFRALRKLRSIADAEVTS